MSLLSSTTVYLIVFVRTAFLNINLYLLIELSTSELNFNGFSIVINLLVLPMVLLLFFSVAPRVIGAAMLSISSFLVVEFNPEI